MRALPVRRNKASARNEAPANAAPKMRELEKGLSKVFCGAEDKAK